MCSIRSTRSTPFLYALPARLGGLLIGFSFALANRFGPPLLPLVDSRSEGEDATKLNFDVFKPPDKLSFRFLWPRVVCFILLIFATRLRPGGLLMRLINDVAFCTSGVGWGGKQRTLFCLSFNMLLMLRYGLFPWLLTRSWYYATVDSAWVHMKNNIPASLSSKSPLIETSIRAWQWRFTRYHIPAFGCQKRTQLKLRWRKKMRANSKLRQNSILQNGSFFGPPKTWKNAILPQKTQAQSKTHCNYMRFVLAKVSKTL